MNLMNLLNSQTVAPLPLIISLGFASWLIMHYVTSQDLDMFLLVWFRKLAGYFEFTNSAATCFRCFSFWTGWLVVIIYFGFDAKDHVLTSLSVSGFTILANRITSLDFSFGFDDEEENEPETKEENETEPTEG